MAYVPRRYDLGIIEALALTGALDPQLGSGDRRDRLALTQEWLNAVDEEGEWDPADGDAGEDARPPGHLVVASTAPDSPSELGASSPAPSSTATRRR